jgi:hypothetical protein
LDARLTTLLCKKKNIVAKSKEVKTGCNLAESSKEGCGSKRTVLQIMMTIMIFKYLLLSFHIIVFLWCSPKCILEKTCYALERMKENKHVWLIFLESAGIIRDESDASVSYYSLIYGQVSEIVRFRAIKQYLVFFVAPSFSVHLALLGNKG